MIVLKVIFDCANSNTHSILVKCNCSAFPCIYNDTCSIQAKDVQINCSCLSNKWSSNLFFFWRRLFEIRENTAIAWNKDTRGTFLHAGSESDTQNKATNVTFQATNAWYHCPPEKHRPLNIFHLFHHHVKSIIIIIIASYRATSRK